MLTQFHQFRFLVVCPALLIGALTGGSLIAASQESKKEKKVKKSAASAAEKLLGSWRMMELEVGGKKSKTPFEMVFVFKKDVVEQQFGQRQSAHKYKLDPKHPNHLDLTRERGGRKREFKMIFSIEGDTLKMCSGGADKDRPKAFTSEGSYTIQILKRIKQEEKDKDKDE